MKLKELKKLLDKATLRQLEQEIYYQSEEYAISGIVTKIARAKQHLYTTHEDDPSPLYTAKQLREQGLDKDDISNCDIEIPKGSFIINL